MVKSCYKQRPYCLSLDFPYRLQHPASQLEGNRMLLSLTRLIIYIAGAYLSLSAGCECRNFQGGHKFIKSFPARTPYQRLFTKMQCEKDMGKTGMGTLTYLGYAGVLVTTITGILALVLYACFALAGKLYLADYAALLWACLGMGWGMVSFLLMGIDSLISRFF